MFVFFHLFLRVEMSLWFRCNSRTSLTDVYDKGQMGKKEKKNKIGEVKTHTVLQWFCVYNMSDWGNEWLQGNRKHRGNKIGPWLETVVVSRQYPRVRAVSGLFWFPAEILFEIQIQTHDKYCVFVYCLWENMKGNCSETGTAQHQNWGWSHTERGQ